VPHPLAVLSDQLNGPAGSNTHRITIFFKDERILVSPAPGILFQLLLRVAAQLLKGEDIRLLKINPVDEVLVPQGIFPPVEPVSDVVGDHSERFDIFLTAHFEMGTYQQQ
jgi:hypothetical protein